jgi:hypothetical protein
VNGRCDFCPRPGRLASCRCPSGHADVGVWVCTEKHEPWLNSVEIACRQCQDGQPSRIVALYETSSAALVAEVERLHAIVKRARDLADIYLSGDDDCEAIGVEFHRVLDGEEP